MFDGSFKLFFRGGDVGVVVLCASVLKFPAARDLVCRKFGLGVLYNLLVNSEMT